MTPLKKKDLIYTIIKRTIEKTFKDLAREKLGDYEGYNPMRSHSLKSAFRTLLRDVKMNDASVEFFIGHKIPEHKRVYLNKSREGWKTTYREYEYALTPDGVNRDA